MKHADTGDCIRKSDWLLAAAVLLMTCFWPCFFQYVNNFPESRFFDAMTFAGLLLITAAVLFGLWFAVYRRPLKALLQTEVCMLAVINLGMVVRIMLRHFWGMPVRLALLLLLLPLILTALLFWRWKRPGRLLCQLLALFLAALVIMSLVQFAPKKIRRILDVRQTAEQTQELPVPKQMPEKLPNVYLFLYDEYAGPMNLDRYYGVRDPMYPALREMRFNVSVRSYNRESLYTSKLIPDLLNLDFNAPEYFDTGDGRSPMLYRLFASMGYQVKIINHLGFLDRDDAIDLTPEQIQDSICQILYDNSLFSVTPIGTLVEKLPQLDRALHYREGVLEILDTFDRAAEYTEGKPTFTVGYIQLPHAAFVFNEDGSLSQGGESNWWQLEYYLNQMYYTGSRIVGMAEKIIAEDPDAVIILQSDHGARLPNHLHTDYGNEFDWIEETPHMQNILNVVYFGGRPLEVEGLSGINTLKQVLNTLYGYEFSMTEPEQYYLPY